MKFKRNYLYFILILIFGCNQKDVNPQDVCYCMSSYSIIGEDREQNEVYEDCVFEIGVALSNDNSRDDEQNRLLANAMNEICPLESYKFFRFLNRDK